MENKMAMVFSAIVISILLIVIGYNFAPGIRETVNKNQTAVQIVDDQTRYETLKKVEDTCRAMISSYESDVLTWNQYKNSENEAERTWAAQAKMRANKTASSYNNYILQNNFMWNDNIPEDIRTTLDIIE